MEAPSSHLVNLKTLPDLKFDTEGYPKQKEYFLILQTLVYISLSREEKECYIGDNSQHNKKYMRITFLITDPKGRRKKSNSHIFRVAKAFIAYVTRI